MREDPGGRFNCDPSGCANYERLRLVYVPEPDAETAALWIARRLAMDTRGGGTKATDLVGPVESVQGAPDTSVPSP